MSFLGNTTYFGNTKLFVGGLNYNTTDEQLGQFFSKFGTVQECVIMKFPDSGESRGFGFVTFSNEQEVAWCLSSLPLTLDGKNVDVKRAEAPTRDGTKIGGGIRDGVKRKGGDANCKVFVGGLNYSTQDDMLKQVFSRYGKVNDWVIMKFPDSGESRGFGFVTFSSPEEVERCLINQPIIVDGKSVDIKKAEPPSARASQTTKPLNNKRYKQKEKESSIENKMPRGGGTMADICSGGNQCGGGFGNNCGHDTFSTIASQVVAMTTNSHKQEPVKEEAQDYSAYYVEYSKWYASWRQYNDYLQAASGGATRQAPPLPPGPRPKTPPQDQNAAQKTPAAKENPASIKAGPQYNQEYFVGRQADQYSQQYWSGQHNASQYNPADPYNSVKHYNPADPYNSVNQYNTADQYNQQVSSQYQGAQGSASAQREGSNQRQDQPRKRKSDSAQFRHDQSGYNNGASGYNVDRPGYSDDGNRSNDENEYSNYRNRYDNAGHRYDNDGPDESRYDNRDGPGFNNERPRFNNDGPWPRNQNNGFGGSFGHDHGAGGGGGGSYGHEHGAGEHGVGDGVEPERNEFYYHNLETLKRKKMRMSS